MGLFYESCTARVLCRPSHVAWQNFVYVDFRGTEKVRREKGGGGKQKLVRYYKVYILTDDLITGRCTMLVCVVARRRHSVILSSALRLRYTLTDVCTS